MLDTVTRNDVVSDTAPPIGNVVHFPLQRENGFGGGDRYGAGRGVNLPMVIAVLAFHAILIAALVHARTVYVHKKEAALAVVNLMPPPPPPSEETPPPATPETVIPPPIVRTPPRPTPITVAEVPIVRPAPVTFSPPAPPAPPALPPAPPTTVQAGDLSARMLAGKAPRYPIESRRKHEQGTVVLAVTLGVDGRVAAISVAQSSGFGRLDDAARDAVKSWRWEPMIKDGQPVRVSGLVEIPFVLQG